MDNSETMATFGTQDTERKQTHSQILICDVFTYDVVEWHYLNVFQWTVTFGIMTKQVQADCHFLYIRMLTTT